MQATTALGFMALIALPLPRNLFYETFLLLHHLLAVPLLYGLWQCFEHQRINRLYLLIAISCYGSLAVVRCIRLARRTFARGRGWARARIDRRGDILIATIALARPFRTDAGLAGRFIYLTAPGVSALSFLQRHPFSIAWWAQQADGDIYSVSLLLKVRNGFTQELAQYCSSTSTSQALTCAIDGLYGQHLDTSPYRAVVMFASGIGVAGQLALVKESIIQYYARRSCLQRIVLVWKVDREGKIQYVYVCVTLTSRR